MFTGYSKSVEGMKVWEEISGALNQQFGRHRSALTCFRHAKEVESSESSEIEEEAKNSNESNIEDEVWDESDIEDDAWEKDE